MRKLIIILCLLPPAIWLLACAGCHGGGGSGGSFSPEGGQTIVDQYSSLTDLVSSIGDGHRNLSAGTSTELSEIPTSLKLTLKEGLDDPSRLTDYISVTCESEEDITISESTDTEDTITSNEFDIVFTYPLPQQGSCQLAITNSTSASNISRDVTIKSAEAVTYSFTLPCAVEDEFRDEFQAEDSLGCWSSISSPSNATLTYDVTSDGEFKQVLTRTTSNDGPFVSVFRSNYNASNFTLELKIADFEGLYTTSRDALGIFVANPAVNEEGTYSTDFFLYCGLSGNSGLGLSLGMFDSATSTVIVAYDVIGSGDEFTEITGSDLKAIFLRLTKSGFSYSCEAFIGEDSLSMISDTEPESSATYSTMRLEDDYVIGILYALERTIGDTMTIWIDSLTFLEN